MPGCKMGWWGGGEVVVVESKIFLDARIISIAHSHFTHFVNLKVCTSYLPFAKVFLILFFLCEILFEKVYICSSISFHLSESS